MYLKKSYNITHSAILKFKLFYASTTTTLPDFRYSKKNLPYYKPRLQPGSQINLPKVLPLKGTKANAIHIDIKRASEGGSHPERLISRQARNDWVIFENPKAPYRHQGCIERASPSALFFSFHVKSDTCAHIPFPRTNGPRAAP